MNLIATITINPDMTSSAVYFLDGIEISADEYATIQEEAADRYYNGTEEA